VNKIANKCKQILLDAHIDSFSEIDFNVNEKVHTLSYEYIIDTYIQASEEFQLVFLSALQKSMDGSITFNDPSLKEDRDRLELNHSIYWA